MRRIINAVIAIRFARKLHIAGLIRYQEEEKMKIACQEGLVPGRDLAEKLDNLAEYGFDGIEFSGQGIEERQDEIRKATENHKVNPSTICGGIRGCLLDGDGEQRRFAMSDIGKLLKVVGNIGAIGVILVPVSGIPLVPDLRPYKTAFELEKELLLVLLQELAQIAEKAGSIILVEPLNRYETHFLKTLDEAVGICNQIISPNVQIMADFFHMSIEEQNIVESIETAGSFIRHVHLADSTRLLPGYGHTDFKYVKN